MPEMQKSYRQRFPWLWLITDTHFHQLVLGIGAEHQVLHNLGIRWLFLLRNSHFYFLNYNWVGF